MSLQIKCPGCQSTLQIPDTARGKQVRCSSCQKVLKVPEGAAPSRPASSPTAPAPASTGTLQIRCPGCQATLKLRAAMAGKVVKCSQCQTQLKVPGGAATGQPAARPSTPAPQPAPGGFGNDDIFGNLPSVPSPTAGGQPRAFAGSPAPKHSPAPMNPYRVQAPGGGARPHGGSSGLRSGRASWLYTVPGVFMAVWAVLVIAVGIFQFGVIGYLVFSGQLNMQQVDMGRFAGQSAGRFLAIALQVAVVAGSIGMIQRSNLKSARTAAVISAIPCFGCLVFPIGIWACVLLFSDKAERDFA
ncbi:zinc finger domain-containing protein [Aporhodopirellula aestuarii]|uniref:Zinc finger/thioredoxin putative domain-containing protein n=1 Tax=Aporhodopirellula aestuarii TaxID=2950107 RepID=A0ABT0U3N4_9BACT|nr:hypothetical protein [Aporhodopirellula aestuarii]MCM2371274.1 hypothetical protein [Aporhodopirellula aestuarii]